MQLTNISWRSIVTYFWRQRTFLMPMHMGKKWAHARTPPQKFILLLRYNLFMGVNEMCVKNITVTVSVRVSVMVRVSLVWLVSITVLVRVSATVRASLVWLVVLVASSVAICRPTVCIAKCSQLSHGRPCDSWLHLSIHTTGHVFSIIFAFWLYTRPAVHGRPCV